MKRKYILVGILFGIELLLVILLFLFFYTNVFHRVSAPSLNEVTSNNVQYNSEDLPMQTPMVEMTELDAQKIPAIYNADIYVSKDFGCVDKNFGIKIYSSQDFLASKIDIDSFQFLITDNQYKDLNNDGVEDLLICTSKDLSNETRIVFNVFEGRGNVFGKVHFEY